ncbi:uncharacterized protein B0T23DRAFT_417674 [Neurospora hispaniola]|uniref:Uncharacterized protein n=1 Tax=Neurospora hispaniola TaxID=588809 RepID=A0AAJ0IH81_9PEZI|nr:hypothetical protein B0T23DRAFT_417674 [Neurospora hispaniola]
MARLKHLPVEVRARICEFIGNIADAPSDFQPDPRELDNFFLLDKDDSPFSRVLFRIAVVGGPRRHIRSLFVTREGSEHNVAEEALAQFKQELRPLVLTRTIDELYDASYFRGFESGLSFEEFRDNRPWNYTATGFSTMLLLKFADYVLRAIIQLCPFLSGFHICCGIYDFKVHALARTKELRVINGFDDRVECPDEEITTFESIPTWNTILHLFKDTLELLVFDGYHSRFGDSKDRFGPTRMLSLEDFEKLAYLKVPLYMLRRDGHTLRVPKKGQKVLDLVRTKFPKGLKKADIVVFESSGSFEGLGGVTQNFIAPIKTSKVRLIEAITNS